MSDRQARRWLATNSAEWRAIRGQVLLDEPFCEVIGCVDISMHVDHRNGRADREEDYRRSNLQALCAGHHSEKTNQERAGLTFRPKGCTADGTPYRPPAPYLVRTDE